MYYTKFQRGAMLAITCACIAIVTMMLLDKCSSGKGFERDHSCGMTNVNRFGIDTITLDCDRELRVEVLERVKAADGKKSYMIELSTETQPAVYEDSNGEDSIGGPEFYPVQFDEAEMDDILNAMKSTIKQLQEPQPGKQILFVSDYGYLFSSTCQKDSTWTHSITCDIDIELNRGQISALTKAMQKAVNFIKKRRNET